MKASATGNEVSPGFFQKKSRYCLKLSYGRRPRRSNHTNPEAQANALQLHYRFVNFLSDQCNTTLIGYGAAAEEGDIERVDIHARLLHHTAIATIPLEVDIV